MIKDNFIKTTIKDFLNEKQINEISSDTFKNIINISKERGTDRRTYKLGQLYLNKFIGKDFMGGKITDIGVHSPNQSNYRIVSIEITKNSYKDNGKSNIVKDYIYYDIDKDIYDVGEIDRKDAFVLSKISQYVNPETKYKETGKHFKIKGW